MPLRTDRFTLPELKFLPPQTPSPPPTPAPVKYVVYVSSDGRWILAIIIGIMPANSSGYMSYKISDTYGRIYSTTTRIVHEPTHEQIQL